METTTNETNGTGLTDSGERAIETIRTWNAKASKVVWSLNGGGSCGARNAKEALEWALAFARSIESGEEVDALYQSDWLRHYGATDLTAAIRDLAAFCGSEGLAVGVEAIRDGIEAYNRKAGTGYYRNGVLQVRP